MNQPTQMSDAELGALLAKLESAPGGTKNLAHLRGQGLALLRRLVDEVSVRLAGMDAAPDPADSRATDLRRLAHAARIRAGAALQRRELAEDIVIACLINLDNPDWNPLDASTSKDPSESLILSFLEPDPPPDGPQAT